MFSSLSPANQVAGLPIGRRAGQIILEITIANFIDLTASVEGSGGCHLLHISFYLILLEKRPPHVSNTYNGPQKLLLKEIPISEKTVRVYSSIYYALLRTFFLNQHNALIK